MEMENSWLKILSTTIITISLVLAWGDSILYLLFSGRIPVDLIIIDFILLGDLIFVFYFMKTYKKDISKMVSISSFIFLIVNVVIFMVVLGDEYRIQMTLLMIASLIIFLHTVGISEKMALSDKSNKRENGE